MILQHFGRSIIIAVAFAVSANISECVAQTYVWEGNQNGDGPFVHDPPNGDPFVYYYPISDSWIAGEIRSDDFLQAPSNWSRPDFPNSPSATVVIPGAAPGKTYPPRLGNEVSVSTVDVNTAATLLLGGRLNISNAVSNAGRIDLLNGGYVNGRITNGPNGVIRAANSTLRGPVLNEGKIELVPLSLPLQFDDAEYSGSGIIEGDAAGTGVAGKVTVVGGEMTFRKGRIFVGSGLAHINLTNEASVGFDDVDASLSGGVTNRGSIRVGDGATLDIGAVIDNTNGSLDIGSGGIAKLNQSGVLNGGTVNGILRLVGAATLTGQIANAGELRFQNAFYNYMQDARISGGQISGDDIGVAIGKLTTEGVTFRNDTFYLGSQGNGPLYWTIEATNTVMNIDLRMDHGNATNNGRLVVADGGIFRSGYFDNTNGIIEVQEGGRFIQGGGELRGGTIVGTAQVLGGTLTGTFSMEQGELAYPTGGFSFVEDAIFRGGQITADELGSGIVGGTLTTDGVTFRQGQFHLEPSGAAGVDWTIIGTNTVDDMTLFGGRTTTNTGRLVVADGAVFRSGNFDNSNAVIEVQEGGQFIQGNGELRGGIIIGKILVPGGTLTGEIEMEQGILAYPNGGFSFVQDAIFRGGQIIADQTTGQIAAGQMTTDGVTFRHGTFILAPSGTAGVDWTIIGTNTVDDMTLHGGRTTNEGRLVIADGAVFHSGTFNNAGGFIEIQEGGVFYAQNLTNGDGIIRVDGDFYANVLLDLQGGDLQGTGVIHGAIINSNGAISPGASPGSLLVDGNYTQQQTALLSLEIGGNVAGESYDQFKVTGNATIAGGIDIEFVDGFLPRVGDRYDLILANGTLNLASDITISVFGVPDAFRYSTDIGGGVLSMQVVSVPEPPSLVLSMMTLLAAMVGISIRAPRTLTSP